MIRTDIFSSFLATYFERFVALKRARGINYVSQTNTLLTFDQHVATQSPDPPLRREVLTQYLASLEHLSPRARDNVVGVVWAAVNYALLHGGDVETLPARPPSSPRYLRQRQPRILSLLEVESLLSTARQLPPTDILWPSTMATLFGLLYATGIRIGEALALDVGDLNRCDRILTVRNGKFGKSRELPLRKSTAEALVRYVEHPFRPVSIEASVPIFVSTRGRRMAYSTVRTSFRKVCSAAGITQPWPQPHDFRHTFAVTRVAMWYEQERDVNALLPALSTYLGHVSIENTRRYLTANGSLLEQAARRFARYTSTLEEVLS